MERSYKIIDNRYAILKTIGRGSMGKVKLCIDMETQEKLAVKIISRTAAECDVRTHREAALLLLLSHPNIVKLKDFIVHKHHYFLFFEYVEGGQLLDLIVNHGKLSERRAREMMRQIVSSVDYCHQNSIVHRDLKIENILLDRFGNLKIIDFGLANFYSNKSHLETFCGSLYFAAPELLSGQKYIGPSVDVWSLGVILYVLLVGKVPFDDPKLHVLHEKIKSGRVAYPSHLSKEAKGLLSGMLTVHTPKRLTIHQIKQSDWLIFGYHEPVLNILPRREKLPMPLDETIIEKIANTNLFMEKARYDAMSTEEAEKQWIHDAIQRDQTNFEIQAVLEKPVQLSAVTCIYYLMMEKLEEEKKLNSLAHNTRNFLEPISEEPRFILSDIPLLKDTELSHQLKRASTTLAVRSKPKNPKVHKRATSLADSLTKSITRGFRKLSIAFTRLEEDKGAVPRRASDSKAYEMHKRYMSEEGEGTQPKQKLVSVAMTSGLPLDKLVAQLECVLKELQIDFTLVSTDWTFVCEQAEASKKKAKLQEQIILSNEITFDSVVRFEVSVVRIPFMNSLHGIQFRRIHGDMRQYKQMCQLVLKQLK